MTDVRRVVLVCMFAACAKLEKDVPMQPASCQTTLPRVPRAETGSEILGACVDGAGLQVAFVARDGKRAIADLVLREVRLTLAKQIPRADGGDAWSSYINRIDPAGQGGWPGRDDAVQATADGDGVLQPVGEGVYIYKFGTNPKAVTLPIAVTWEPSRRHRISLEFRGVDRVLPASNPVLDFRPGAPAETRKLDPSGSDIVTTKACNSCHGGLAAHGGARTELRACVTCHNPGSKDAQSGESVELASLVHRIHRGKNLPSVKAGGKFVIWGNANRAFDFSTVGYPQDVRNCRKCHDEREAATPAAVAWRARPGVVACGSCHDNIAFGDTVAAGKKAHPRGARAGDDCASCHTSEDVDAKHRLPFVTSANPAAPMGTPLFGYEILALASARGGEQPVVTFRIKMNGQPLDVRALPANLAYGPRFVVGWTGSDGPFGPAADYDNRGSGQPVGQPASFALDAKLAATLAANPDGSFTTPAGALGSLPPGVRNVVVTLESYFVVKNAAGQDVRGLAGDTAVLAAPGAPARRASVATDKCNVCHERLSAHGGNRANNVAACVVCHNPAATDYRMRPASLDMDMDRMLDDPNALGIDGRRESSINFAGMIHSIHAGETLAAARNVIYGFGRTAIDFKEVRYPRRLADCQACHLDKAAGLPLALNATAVTHLSSALPTSDRTGAFAVTPDDDVKMTPAGSACTGCHDSLAAQAHAMVSAPFQVLRPRGTEIDACATCHGAGRPYDVASVHAPKSR